MTGVRDFLSWILTSLGDFFTSAVDVVFDLFYDLFNSIFRPFIGVFDSNVESYGSEFFAFFFKQASAFPLSINIVYWAVGIFLFIFIMKHVIFPLIVTVIDNIIDIFTPS